MPITGKKLIKMVLTLGWTCDRVTGSHYVLIKGSQRVVIPYHNKELPKKTLKQILHITGPIDGVKL